MPEIYWIIIPLFFFVSLAYTSVGLGGGSSYVALLLLFGFPLTKIPPIALFLNIIAASVALYKFGKRGFFPPKLVFPLLLASVPATFLGAQLTLNENILMIIFAAVLPLLGLVLLLKKREIRPRFSLERKQTWVVSFFLGAILGFMAGIMGIGGGIFLGPVLLLVGMAASKEVAGICSAFVLVNSSIGLISHYLQGRVEFSALFALGVAVFLGAQIGSFLGSRKFSLLALQKIFAIILLIVSVKMAWRIIG